MDLGAFPIALMGIALLVPVLYSAAWKRESLRKTAALWALSVVIVALYPAVTYAFELGGNFGYFLAKLVFFVLLPTALLMHLEKWGARTVFINVGVRRKNLESSVAYGLLAALVIIAVTVAIRLIWGRWREARTPAGASPCSWMPSTRSSCSAGSFSST